MAVTTDTRRKGRQTPTVSRILPYDRSLGREAVELYNSIGRTAQEWQELMLYDLLAVNEDGLWTHTKFGYSIMGETVAKASDNPEMYSKIWDWFREMLASKFAEVKHLQESYKT